MYTVHVHVIQHVHAHAQYVLRLPFPAPYHELLSASTASLSETTLFRAPLIDFV